MWVACGPTAALPTELTISYVKEMKRTSQTSVSWDVKSYHKDQNREGWDEEVD